jgi:hypothetical protein
VLDKGVTNSLVVAFNPALDGYTNGLIVRVKVAHPNTGPSQIDCGPGFRPIVRIDGSPLAPSDMVAGGVAVLVYVDTEFQLVNPNIAAAIESAIEGISGGGGGPVTGGGGTTYVTNVYNGFQGMASWMVAGSFNWTVPVGVRKLWVKLWAGGGPGIEWTPHDVQGLFIKGGDGGYCEDLYDVVPGTVMQINVGAGAPPPVPITTGNVFHDAATWKATYGQPSSFGAAGQPVICSCTGGRGCYPNPPGDVDPSPGEPGIGTGARIVRSNGLYGRGGGSYQTSDGVHDDYAEISGDPGACILLY